MPPTVDKVGGGASSSPQPSPPVIKRQASFSDPKALTRTDSSLKRSGLLQSPKRNTSGRRRRSRQPPPVRWDRDKMLSEDQKRFLQDFFHKEPCPYGHRVFKHAAIIFGVLQHDLAETNPQVRRQKDDEAKQKLAELPPLEYESLTEQRLVFNLVFSALKCKYI